MGIVKGHIQQLGADLVYYLSFEISGRAKWLQSCRLTLASLLGWFKRWLLTEQVSARCIRGAQG